MQEFDIGFEDIPEEPQEEEKEMVNIKFEIEKIPPKYGKWPKGATFYHYDELKELAKQSNITVVKDKLKLVLSLIRLFLDFNKIPRSPTLFGIEKSKGTRYYTQDEMNSFFKGIGVPRNYNYEKKIAFLSRRVGPN